MSMETNEMYAGLGEIANDQQLEQVAELAQQQIDLAKEVEDLEKQLEDRKNTLKNVQENLLPTALMACNLEEIKLKSGFKVSISKFYSANPSDPKAAFQWLRDHGHDSIIKNEVVASFGKGEDKKAEQCLARLIKAGYVANQKESVHHQTMKAFVKEQLEGENGANFPRDLFGVYQGNKAVIKQVK